MPVVTILVHVGNVERWILLSKKCFFLCHTCFEGTVNDLITIFPMGRKCNMKIFLISKTFFWIITVYSFSFIRFPIPHIVRDIYISSLFNCIRNGLLNKESLKKLYVLEIVSNLCTVLRTC